MRKDISKLVTEPSRNGRKWAITKKYGGRVSIVHDPEHDYLNEIGGFHSSSRRRQKNHKEFSDFLSPIEGNLRKNVGRPWNDVHSEFCAVMDRRGLAGWHVYAQHLMRDVEQKVYMGVDGKVYVYGAGVRNDKIKYDYELKKWVDNPGGSIHVHHDVEVTGYYVHPITGILCHNGSKDYQDPYKSYQKPNPRIIDTIFIRDGKLHSYSTRYEHPKLYPDAHLSTHFQPSNEYYRLEECGNRPKSRFEAWFHYRIQKIDESYWLPVDAKDVARGALYFKKHRFDSDGNAYIWQERIIEKSHKRSCKRKEIQAIREYLKTRVVPNDKLIIRGI